ncbi:hypothetical protein Csa_023279 [Cucumis sativus]|uniref:Uncharacterized protein n=1 Tax=Cucumis sativus TaxID=3659 RepID=A0A0A0M127_CUCSA|nr:hypothetical protein Csa_023279 [Cucumis sativus]
MHRKRFARCQKLSRGGHWEYNVGGDFFDASEGRRQYCLIRSSQGRCVAAIGIEVSLTSPPCVG